MSCHPLHFDGPPLPGKTDEEVTRAWEEFKKEDQVDRRAIRRQHRFKPGHEPDFYEPESGVVYTNYRHEEEKEPDQRDMLSGGPPSGFPCERCGTETVVAGSMSVWDQYQQSEVSVVNLSSITEARKRELQEERVLVLKCPSCFKTYQWAEEFLPKRLGHGE